MKMGIAVLVIKLLGQFMHLFQMFRSAASRVTLAGLLASLAYASAWANSADLITMRNAFNQGHFEQVVEMSALEIVEARKAGSYSDAAEAGLMASRALIQLERYDEADAVVNETLSDAKRLSLYPEKLASVYFCKAALARNKQDFMSASTFSRDAFALAPKNRLVEIEYHLAVGRILFKAGYDVAAIVWLEKAENLSRDVAKTNLYYEILRFLSLAWSSKFYYTKALAYSEKLVAASEKSEYRFIHRLALFETANLLNAAGQEHRARMLFEEGLQLALRETDDYQSSLFLSTLLLSSLYRNDIGSAEKHLQMLERLDQTQEFKFESTLGKGVIAAYKGRDKQSSDIFNELKSLRNRSEYIVPYWQSTIAEQRKDWARLIEQSQTLQKLSEAENYREDLPRIYLNLAKGNWGLGKSDLALEYANKAARLIDRSPDEGNIPLSLSILETYHSIYRLLSEIKENSPDSNDAFDLADFIKGRVLKDRIRYSKIKHIPNFSTERRQRAASLSKDFIERGENVELERLERSVTQQIPETSRDRFEAIDRHRLESLKDFAIVSYFFTLSGELRAYIVETGKPIRIVKLSISERECEGLAETTRRKIRDRIFFKSDGKEIFDRLVAPLSLSAGNLVFVPDKSLWKIPFHALSPDAQTYLIEQKTISYSQSVTMLVNLLKEKTPVRRTARVFANNRFGKRTLRFVNSEASSVAKIFGVTPVLGSGEQQFLTLSGDADILHFSMHAKADSEEPLASYLAFKSFGQNDGRLSVEDILKVRLKRQSLAFLASCDTSSVLNGEGLVSIAWAMLGSGSTSVISAQWEANDKSTEMFAEQFYKEYKDGKSSAKAIQSAAISMIRNKSSETHEPYYWAAFTLLGDFR